MLQFKNILTRDYAGRAAILVFFGGLVIVKTSTTIQLFGSFPASPTTSTYLNLLIALASIAFLLLILGTTLVRLKPSLTATGFEARISALLGTFLMATLAMLPPGDVPDMVKIAGLVFAFLGTALSAYVLLYLGRSFSIMAEARKLVISGPYSVVRHPLYVAEEIAIIGIILAHFSVWAVAIGAVHWLFQMRRMLNEERVLGAAFSEYDPYAKSVPRVIPLGLLPRLKAG